MSKSGPLSEAQRRREVWERLRQLQSQVAARNTDLDEQAAEALAEQLGDEAMAALIARGAVCFER